VVGGLRADERETIKRKAPRELHLYKCWGAKERGRQASGPLTTGLPASAGIFDTRRLTQRTRPSRRATIRGIRAPRCQPLRCSALAGHRKGKQPFVRRHHASPPLPINSAVRATYHGRT